MGFWRELGSLLLPPACARCGLEVAGEAILCRPCDVGLPRLHPDLCRLCQAARPAPTGGCCPACRREPTPLEACLAASPYAGDLAAAMQRFKYPRPGLAGLDPAPGALLAWCLLEAARRAPGPAQLVVPVPLHPERLRRRGFNPAALLARSLARAQGLAVAPGALERVRATPSQTGLDRRARARNVAGAFRAARGRQLPERVWLVDDVVTTGATLREAARALRRAGARRVVGLAPLRTLSVR